LDCRDMVLSDEYLEIITDFPLGLLNIPQIRQGEYCASPVSDNMEIIYLRNTATGELSLDRFGYRIMPKIFGPAERAQGDGILTQDFGLEASGISQVQRPPLSLSGRGVTLAFIDTGIDWANDIFKREDGESRLLALWDQTLQTGAPPEGFLYGTQFLRQEINNALGKDNPYEDIPSRDEIGHGSAMAAVAAGSVAPQADIVAVKLRPCKPYLKQYYRADGQVAYSETDLLLALKYVREFAVPFRRPLVICLGLGTSLGDHNGNSMLDRFLDEISRDKSTCVVVAGGNEGNRRGHYEGRITEQPDEVEIRVGAGEEGFFVEFWANLPDAYQIRVRSPGGEEIPWTNPAFPQSLSYGFVYEDTRISVYTEVVEGNSGEQVTLLRFTNPTEGIWRIGVRAVGRPENGIFHLWLPMEQFLGSDTYFVQSDPYVTLTEPAMAREVISFSAYDDRNDSFYQESGRGFTKAGLPKPDLCAPGVSVRTLGSVRNGSSFAAAYGGGAAALFLQWAVLEENRPFVTTGEIKNYFIKGATRDPSLNYPNPLWGYGRLNLENVFTSLANLSRT